MMRRGILVAPYIGASQLHLNHNNNNTNSHFCSSKDAAFFSARYTSARFQGGSSNNSQNNSSNNRGGRGRLHKFIQEQQPASQPRPHPSQQEQRPYPTRNQRSAQSGGGGGGGRSHTPRGGGGGDGFSYRAAPQAPPAAAAGPTSDWAARLRQELLQEQDPLGGMAHKDYYRDPAKGYTPQYAPRQFAQGGALAYPHPTSSVHYQAASAARDYYAHDVSRLKGEAREARAGLRQLHSAEEREAFLQQGVPADRYEAALPSNQSTSVLDQLRHSGPTSRAAQQQHGLVDRFTAATTSGATGGGGVQGTLDSRDLQQLYEQQFATQQDNILAERLHEEHGLRDKERFDFNMLQRTSRVRFPGYDKDRSKAQQEGTPFAAQQLPPGMPVSSMTEAQQALRATPLPSTEAQVTAGYARNTVAEEPKLGEALTAELVEGLHATQKASERQRRRERKQRFGLGRQSALVQDGGPDRRTLQRHKNDERLVDAMLFSSNAYRKTATDSHTDAYTRGSTAGGVGHLLNNQFDIARREDRVGRGEADLTEKATIHYGTPVAQSLDEFVLRHRNARGERPLDYFSPFPHFRDLRLYQVYDDTEGFSMMRQRPEFLEWELFCRYRAHHQQRRELALRHGLEPVANETAQERDARRAALDALCEQTPFDPTRIALHDEERPVHVETLRKWFGVYMLPSPTIVEAVVGTTGALGLHGQHLTDEMGTEDAREHLLSGRYLNKLLLQEGYQHRVHRGFVTDVLGRAPEPVIKYAQTPETLQHFTKEEQAMYEQYVKQETERQLGAWRRVQRGRRYIPHKQQYGEIKSQGYPVQVIDAQNEKTGAVLTIAAKPYEKLLAEQKQQSSTEPAAPISVKVDGESCRLLHDTQREVVPMVVQLEHGEEIEMTSEDFTTYPLEEAASARYNHALNYGIQDYHYNRGNYVETQDVLWETATAKGEEGWSPATHADGLVAGLPVRARRHVGPVDAAEGMPGTRRVTGDAQRGRIVAYAKEPFFNPGTRTVTVEFAADREVQQVPLADVLIWQRRYFGPERTVGEETRRYNPTGLRRYVDVTDPDRQRARAEEGLDAAGGKRKDHFLDKYSVHSPAHAEQQARRLRTTKQITEIDQWHPRFDSQRSDNHRPLSISHRRDYVRQGYFPRYTPWEWIVLQEADQPILHDTIRTDNTGQSRFFSLNRFWRHKARPHGYLRHYEHEVRDLLQYVDGVVPWKQAQKLRTYWEVRQHHPMPQFNRPEVAMHRNAAGLLPAHLWEVDKKTGKVRGVKDSVRDYQTNTPLPKWVQL